jgi:hypothetical protein
MEGALMSGLNLRCVQGGATRFVSLAKLKVSMMVY